MAVGSLSPVGIQAFYDANGNPLAGGKLFFYLAGTTTPTPAYADVGLTTPLANPVILDAAGRAPELFLGALTYKQVLQNALGTTIWTADNIVTPSALRSMTAVISLTGSQSNVPVPSGVISFITFGNSVALTIDGFAGGTPGQILVLRSGGAAPVFLLHGQGSAAGNQLYNFISSGPTPLSGTHGTAIYLYDGAYWVLIAHEQGAWIAVPHTAANFTANAGGTWTVENGNIVQVNYRLAGTTVLLTVNLSGTSVTGSPTLLSIISFLYTVRTTVNGIPTVVIPQGLPNENGFAGVTGSTAKIDLARAANAVWPSGAGGTAVFMQTMFDVI